MPEYLLQCINPLCGLKFKRQEHFAHMKDRDALRGFHRYFWKAVPVPSHGHGAGT